MYTFELNVKGRTSLLIFCGRNQGSDLDYGEALDETLKSFSGTYSDVIFLVPEFLKENILSLVLQGDRLISNISRYGNNTSIIFCSFDQYGSLQVFSSLNDAVAPYRWDMEELKAVVIYSGINNFLVKRSDAVILAAPPGTTFKKPSGDEYTEFIKASELAIGYAEHQFVAFCLLTKKPRNRTIKRIFVDSNSIAAYIVALMCFMREFSGTYLCSLNYISFNSYDGYKEYEPDYKGDVWVIISASSSNNLGKTLRNDWRDISHDQIVTLLSFKNTEMNEEGKEKGIGDRIISNIGNYSCKRTQAKKQDNLVPLQIIGENFTAQIDPPELVVLKKPHFPIAYREFITSTSNLDLFSLNKYDGKKVRRVCFNPLVYLNQNVSASFYEWLQSICIWNVPHGIRYIAYKLTDVASKQIANQLLTWLPRHVNTLDLNNLSDGDYGDCSILIISPVISSGRIFLKANRDLRMANHSGPRIFVCILSLFKSQKKYEVFEKSLLQAQGDLKYKLFSYKSLMVGETESIDGWENELSVVESFKSSCLIERSRSLRNTSSGIPRGVGFSFSATGNHLHFNKDFAFWGIDYNPDEICHGAVYVTIAAVLQHLRDRPTGDPDSLYHHVYKHAVIDPENFSRFNEGLIQACLWRAAESTEVNYKCLLTASRSFDAILLNLAKEVSKRAENALADLLVGVAVGKIQLHDESLLVIINEIKPITKHVDSIVEIIDYIETVIYGNNNPLERGPEF